MSRRPVQSLKAIHARDRTGLNYEIHRRTEKRGIYEVDILIQGLKKNINLKGLLGLARLYPGT